MEVPVLSPVPGHDAITEVMRRHVPEIAAETVAEIQRELPEYVRPHDRRYARGLEVGVQQAIGRFVELIADPAAPLDEVVALFTEIGAVEAREGRSLEVLQAALARGSKIAVRRLSETAARTDPDLPSSVYGEVIGAIFPYLDRLSSAAARGHAEARASDGMGMRRHRRKLLEMLIADPAPEERTVREQAAWAGWHPPAKVAAVALRAPRGAVPPPKLDPDVLVGLHLREPCLIVPDPDGPGRRAALERAVRGWVAAVGPACTVTGLADSLDWARQALALAGAGGIPADGLIDVTEHMPALVITRTRGLMEPMMARHLEPLERVRPDHRRRQLVQTLIACLECGFNSAKVAGRLYLHPQTVRYRLRTLEELFGERMYDPAHSLEMQMMLHAWLAANPPESASQELAATSKM